MHLPADRPTAAEWHAPVAEFARENGYRFMGDYAFCRVEARYEDSTIKLWISIMGSGSSRATLMGELAEHGEVHCRGEAKVVGEHDVEIRRRTILDRLLSRGVQLGDAEFDTKYVALGKEEDVRRFLRPLVTKAFVGMWSRTQGLCVEDGKVSIVGGEWSLDPRDLAFIIETLGTIATGSSG